MQSWEEKEVIKYNFLYRTGYSVGPVESFKTWIDEVIPKALNEKHTILDIGCGTAPLARKNNYIGIDFSAEAIKKAKKLHPGVSLHCMSITELFEWDVDTVFCCDVMEHVPKEKIEEVINKLYELNAVYYLFSICYKSTKQKDHEGNDPHITIYTPEEWCKILKDKFRIKETFLRKDRNLFIYAERL